MDKKIKIELDKFYYNCSDGCCTNYGTNITVDGVTLLCQNEDAGTIVKEILKHLWYDVELIETYNGE